MRLPQQIILASALMTLAQWSHAQASSTISPESPSPAPATVAPPDVAPSPGVTTPDVQPVPSQDQSQSQTPMQSSGSTNGAIVTPAPEQTVTAERRGLTETDTDPYIQRRIARRQAKDEYKASKREAQQEYSEAKRAAAERFNDMRSAENAQSPRGELNADYLGAGNMSSSGR